MKKRNTKTSPLSFADAAKLLSINDRRDRLLFACSLFLGLRGTSELCKLKWGDLLGESAMVWQPKTSKYRELTIVPKLREIIEWSYEGQPKDNYIFTARRGSKGDKPMTNTGLNKVIRKWFDYFGITTRLNDSSHCLRKTFALNYIKMNGDNIFSLERLRSNFGHADIKTTLRYADIEYERLTMEMKNIQYV
jgi:integrase